MASSFQAGVNTPVVRLCVFCVSRYKRVAVVFRVTSLCSMFPWTAMTWCWTIRFLERRWSVVQFKLDLCVCVCVCCVASEVLFVAVGAILEKRSKHQFNRYTRFTCIHSLSAGSVCAHFLESVIRRFSFFCFLEWQRKKSAPNAPKKFVYTGFVGMSFRRPFSISGRVWERSRPRRTHGPK